MSDSYQFGKRSWPLIRSSVPASIDEGADRVDEVVDRGVPDTRIVWWFQIAKKVLARVGPRDLLEELQTSRRTYAQTGLEQKVLARANERGPQMNGSDSQWGFAIYRSGPRRLPEKALLPSGRRASRSPRLRLRPRPR